MRCLELILQLSPGAPLMIPRKTGETAIRKSTLLYISYKNTDSRHFIGPSYLCKNNKSLRESQEKTHILWPQRKATASWGGIKLKLSNAGGSRSRQRTTEAKRTGQTKVIRLDISEPKDLQEHKKL